MIDWAFVLTGWFIELTIVIPAIALLAWLLARGTVCPHRWRPMKWGSGLDCRRCRICGRFEVYAYWDWHKRRAADFPDAVAADRTGAGDVSRPDVSVGEALAVILSADPVTELREALLRMLKLMDASGVAKRTEEYPRTREYVEGWRDAVKALTDELAAKQEPPMSLAESGPHLADADRTPEARSPLDARAVVDAALAVLADMEPVVIDHETGDRSVPVVTRSSPSVVNLRGALAYLAERDRTPEAETDD